MAYDPTFRFAGMTVPEVSLTSMRRPLGRALPRGMGDRRYFQEFETGVPFDPEVNQFMPDDYLERYYPEPIVPQAKPRRVPTGMADRKAVPPIQQASRRVPTGMADRKELAGTEQAAGVKQDGGFLSQLYADPSSARGQALQAAAATALQLSGYQDRPVTTGQVLGAMMQSGMEAYKDAKPEEVGIEYKAVGDRLFKIYPDGKHELVGGQAAKPREVKSEGPRIRTKDGREVETVYDKHNNLYPAGAAMTEENQLDPEEFNVISQYSQMNVAQRKQGRQELRDSEKAIKMIDGLASEIVKLDAGSLARLQDNYTIKLKSLAPDVFGGMTDEEIAREVAGGKLTALIGASRLSLFGPGVLTEAEAELARQVFVGDIDITNPELALNTLWSIRQSFYEDYSSDVDYYLSFEGNKYSKYTGKEKFGWSEMTDENGRIRLPNEEVGQEAPKTGQTGSGNSWSVVG